jgi:hypothetical protein
MDSASNSVKALRAFADQQKYYYVTALDDNQWDERKVIKFGSVSRYHSGKATLREVEIELEDSNEKGYLISSRAIKIEWDNGKMIEESNEVRKVKLKRNDKDPEMMRTLSFALEKLNRLRIQGPRAKYMEFSLSWSNLNANIK